MLRLLTLDSQKTDKEKPKWYMVDVTFVSRAAHFIPLSLLRNIATSSSVPEEVAYIGAEGAQAIKGASTAHAQLSNLR